MLRTAALTVALAVLPCSLVATATDAASAAAKKKKPTACQRLKGNTGKDLAPAKSVKLVKRFNGDRGTDLLGCVLPAGKVRTIASSQHYDTGDFRYHVDSVAGRFVLISLAGGNQYAYNESTTVWDLRSGPAYSISSLCSMTGGGACGPAPSTLSGPVFITSTGLAVAAISTADGGNPVPTGPLLITSFNSRGVRKDLDSGTDIPAASLTLTGTIASWTHGGQPRSADISSPG